VAKPDDFYRLYGLKQQALHGDCNEERPMVSSTHICIACEAASDSQHLVACFTISLAQWFQPLLILLPCCSC